MVLIYHSCQGRNAAWMKVAPWDNTHVREDYGRSEWKKARALIRNDPPHHWFEGLFIGFIRNPVYETVRASYGLRLN